MMLPIIIEGRDRSRRLDAAQSLPRSLDAVPDGDRPVLEWILHALSLTRAHAPLYVGGYHIEKVIDRFPGLAVRYHPGRDREGEVGALLCAPPFSGSLVLVSASTVILPQALELLCEQKIGRGTYDNGTPVGVYFLSQTMVPMALERARVLLHADPTVQLDDLFAGLADVASIDLDGFAAPVSDQAAVARTIFRGKAQTLDNLAPLVRSAEFLARERFTVAEWRADESAVLQRLVGSFAGKIVVVRSSASNEDGLLSSAAGKYRTCLDVVVDDRKALHEAIASVIASYSSEGRESDLRDEVLVQPQLRDLQACGVLLTRDPRSGAPYFVINEDNVSGRPDTVTGGIGEAIEQNFVAWSASNVEVSEGRAARLVELGKELMQLSHLDALDIEYAITRDDRCHLLQVRPLAAARQAAAVADDDVLDLVAGAERFVDDRMRPVSGLAGASTVLGIMPDWNPAEMIGVAPRSLALSLYQSLIGSDSWAEARRRIGYRDVRPEPLIVALGGRPYVDVRASLNSFLPARLGEQDAARWVDACLGRLRADPALHDKIEFEIAITCLAPDWNKSAVRLDGAGIDKVHFKNALRDLTADIILQRKEPIEQQLAALDKLALRRETLLADRDLSLPGLARQILFLIEDCRRYGVVPFSILARYAFVSLSFLRGFVRTGVIDDVCYQAFMQAVPTVAGTIAADLGSDLSLDLLIDRYGHLRPNSYEITSPNYAADPAQFLKSSAQGDTGHASGNAAAVLAPYRDAVAQSIFSLELSIEPSALATFMASAISGRERAKFEFMKNLNAAIEKIAEFGEGVGLDREQMSLLPVEEITRFATDSMTRADAAQLRRRSAYNEKRWSATRGLRLPDVIRSAADVSAFRVEAWRPNFVSRKRVVAPVVWLDDAEPRTDLSGTIVITRAADPGYDWIFAHGIAGLITEYGGVASHMAIRAAEFALPAAIGCGAVIMETLRGASTVELDCAAERVRVAR